MTTIRNATIEEKGQHFALVAAIVEMFKLNNVPLDSAINASLFAAAQMTCQIAKEEHDQVAVDGFSKMLSQVRDMRAKLKKTKAH